MCTERLEAGRREGSRANSHGICKEHLEGSQTPELADSRARRACGFHCRGHGGSSLIRGRVTVGVQLTPILCPSRREHGTYGIMS